VSVVAGLDSTTKAFTKANNDTSTVEAQADITMNSGGFTVTWSTNNTAMTEILYLALGALGPTAVTLESSTATLMSDGRTHLAWRTGYEVDNIGFRLYREQNGQRVRITSSLLPGTALIGAVVGASAGGRSYSWSESTRLPPDAAPAQYWLEDVDLKGKSTWHSPIAPVRATPAENR
jgi:hypothetical protein